MSMRAAAIGTLAMSILVGVAEADSIVVGPVKDNTLYEGTSRLNSNGAGDHMFVGVTSSNFRRRAVVKFDTSAIPAGSTINSASLQLNMSMTISGTTTVTIHRLLQNWGEEGSDAPGNEGGGDTAEPGDATWEHTFFPDGFWNERGGTFNDAVVSQQDVGDNGFYTFPSTDAFLALVQDWVDDPGSDFGVILIGDESTLTTAKRFDTRENPIEENRPQLMIDFTPPKQNSVKLTDVAVDHGTLISGGLEQLLQSDEDKLQARSLPGFFASEPNVLDVHVAGQSSVQDPDALNLTVESRSNHTFGEVKVRLRNADTGQFDQVGTYQPTTTDSTHMFNGIDAAMYLDGDSLTLSLRHVELVIFSAAGFDDAYDFVEMTVQ